MADLQKGINTYVTLEEADGYVRDNYPSKSVEYTSWFGNGLSEDDKKAMLVQSCRSLNNIKYTGGKRRAGQPLAFPRVRRYGMGPSMITTIFVSQFGDNSLSDSVGLDNGLVVAGYAQIENAIAYSGMSTSTITESRERRLSGLASEKVGSVSKTYNIKDTDVDEVEGGIYTKKVRIILRAWVTESVYAL